MKGDIRVRIVSNGTMSGTMVTTADGTPISVCSIDAHLDAKTMLFTANLEFPFPDLDIVATVDREALENQLKNIQLWRRNLDFSEEQIRTLLSASTPEVRE